MKSLVLQVLIGGHHPSQASWEVANQPRCQEHQHHLVFMGWENQPGTRLPRHRNRSASSAPHSKLAKEPYL